MTKKIALIPARGGSKGLPRKNILNLAGKPLIAHTILAAKNTKIFDDIYVTTDNQDIMNVSETYGAKIIKRPPELAEDHSTTDEVIQHALEYLDLADNDIIFLLQPTSPLRTAKHISEAWILFSKNTKLLMSVTEPKECIFKAFKVNEEGYLQGYFSADAPFKPRQSFEKVYLPNGAIYIFRVKDFLIDHKIPRKFIYPYIMTKEESIDIDDPEDLRACERLLVT